MKNKIIRIYQNADLRSNHQGLAKIAKEDGIDVLELKRGEFVVFMNTTGNRIKIYATGNTIAYCKSPDNRRIEIQVLQRIPTYFNGGEFDYTGALKDFLKMKMAA